MNNSCIPILKPRFLQCLDLHRRICTKRKFHLGHLNWLNTPQGDCPKLGVTIEQAAGSKLGCQRSKKKTKKSPKAAIFHPDSGSTLLAKCKDTLYDLCIYCMIER